MTDRVRVRLATPDDADVVAGHRARMFRDMGQLPPELFEPLRSSARERLTVAIGSGEYVGWLACPRESPDAVIAGAGVQLRLVLPHPRRRADGRVVVASGRHAIVLNVFTEPPWRRQGVAELLMRHIVEWARRERLDRLVLHASSEGRSLYDRLGFVPTNEMRLPDDLGLAVAEGGATRPADW
ncbi:MAG TPA: GNAT family N-acetyltransferase [Gemmatimonadales bacterium]|nr:GNAT family N-acetyltransferase [Gemmatimonadales bacterium]